MAAVRGRAGGDVGMCVSCCVLLGVVWVGTCTGAGMCDQCARYMCRGNRRRLKDGLCTCLPCRCYERAGRRRLELFGEENCVRPGWVTVGQKLNGSNFNPQVRVCMCGLWGGG